MSQFAYGSDDPTPLKNPRFRAIYDLLKSAPYRDWTRKEICDALGLKKTSHMIRLIELGVGYGYFRKSQDLQPNGHGLYCYWFDDLPF